MRGEHFFDIGRHRGKGSATAQPFFKQNFRKRYRGHRRGVQSHGADFFHWNFADQENGAHGPARSNRNTGHHQQSGDLRVGGGRNDSDVGSPSLQRASANRGQRVGNIKLTARVAVFEIPHQGRSIKVGNRRDAQTSHSCFDSSRGF